MSEVQQPIHDTPAADPATHEPTPTTATAPESSTDPIRSQGTNELAPESRPELNAAGVTDGATAAAPTAPNVTNVPKEEKVGKGEVMIESHPINEGILNYRGPGLKGLLPSKKYFWFSDAPLEAKHLTAYLSSHEKAKEIAHPNAAHAQQTGKGLLFFAKRAEDKDHPQGIFNLADVTDVVKGNANDFGFTLNGQKHNFQAVTKSEKDAWIVAIETKAAEAKTSREGIIGSSGYKSALEKYGTPAGAAATTTNSRSLSRPKKASKSRERKIGGSKTDSTTTPVADTTTTTPGTATEKTNPTTQDHHTSGTTSGEKALEVGAGGAAAGTVAGTAAARSGSTSDEDKKTKKSRSRSRNNKRSSLFGSLLGKKDDHDAKKEVKKEEKEEKAEDKAIAKDVKKEEKAEKKEEKAMAKDMKKEDKAEKKEEKAELKAEKKELKEESKEEKKLEKEGNPLSTGQTPGFNAHAVASRVIGEPVMPAEGTSTGTEEASPVASTGATAAEPTTAAETAPASSTRETAPKPNKRASLFGGFFGKKDATSPNTVGTETSPSVPAKDEPSTLSSTAPQLENPVTEPGTGSATGNAVTDTPAVAGEATTPGATTTPTDKRRTSFFGNLGTKKERKAGTTSGDELTDNETKKSSSGGFGGLLRKASRAQKGSSAAKDPADIPLPKETPTTGATTGAATNGAAEEQPALATTEGESAPTTGTQEQTPVSAAA